MKATAMLNKKPMPKPSFEDLRTRLDESARQDVEYFVSGKHWVVLPVSLSDEQRNNLLQNPKLKRSNTLEHISDSEKFYIAHAALGLIHGKNTGGLYKDDLAATPYSSMEELKTFLIADYYHSGIARTKEKIEERFKLLDKWAYFFALDVYPDLRKPSVERIQELLIQKQKGEHLIKLANSDRIFEIPNKKHGVAIALQKYRVTQSELDYIETIAVGLIHGESTQVKGNNGHSVSAGEYKKECEETLKSLYRELGITTGPAANEERLKILNNEAEKFAREIYAGLPRQKG